MSRTLWQKVTYSAKCDYIFDNIIREFDISKANISILRDSNVLTEDQYIYYLSCPRIERQVAIGKLQGSDPRITDILKSGICNAKKTFMEMNSIDDSDVLYVRNDAICIIGSKPITYLKISDRVSFRQSAAYSSFVRFNNMDFLYYYDSFSGNESIDIKGLGDSKILHEKYMIDFISELFYTIQTQGIKHAIELLQIFYNNYISMQLPIEYYREMNPNSKYKLKKGFSMYSSLYIGQATEFYKMYIDISYNESFLRHLNKILASVYFR